MARPTPRDLALIGLVAFSAAALHLYPYWRAQSQTPPGWSFTGNVAANPDYMQYRVWMRQALEEGPIVSNKFTGEPNSPHLLVLFYHGLALASRWTGLSPEWTYAYAGALLAILLTVLLHAAIRQFLDSPHRVWVVFWAVFLGGGLGAHLRLLSQVTWARSNPVVRKTLVEGARSWLTFEDYRSHYVFNTLFDTHFLAIWSLTLAAVLAFHLALRSWSPARLLLATFLYAAATLLHLYEGITLLTINAGVFLILWRKGLLTRPAVVTAGSCAGAVLACIVLQLTLYRSSGLPLPTWRAVNILFSTLLISYPLAWLLIAIGLGEYWRRAGLRECFVLGWALGCTLLTLSAPLYPYPDRGTMTLSVALYLIAGGVYFARHQRLTLRHAAIAVAVMGVTPAVVLAFWWKATRFDTTTPSLFMNVEHRELLDTLRQRASASDLLIVDKSDVPWRTDDLWLAPQYPGRLYCGHFFLTPDYDRKCAAVNGFFRDPVGRAAFLGKERIRFVYVDATAGPERFRVVPGLRLLKAIAAGSLYEFSDPEIAGRN